MHIDLQSDDNPAVERLLSSLELAVVSDPSEIVIRKGRALAAGAAMSYAQAVRVSIVVGSAYEQSNRAGDAIEAIRPRLRDAQTATARYWRARASSALANLYLLHFAEIDVSVYLYESALADFESAGEKEWSANTLSMLGAAFRADGAYTTAADCFRRAITVLGAQIHPLEMTSLSSSLAGCLLEVDSFEAADYAIAPALAALRNGHGIGTSLEALAYASSSIAKGGLKNKRQALFDLAHAKTVADQLSERYVQVHIEIANARMLEFAGKHQKAADTLSIAVGICVDHGLPFQQFEVLRTQIRLSKQAGNFGAALGAMEALERLNKRMETARARFKLGDFDAQRNLEASSEYAKRMQREVELQTRALADTVHKLKTEANQRLASDKRSEYLAGHDHVTGLATRRHFFHSLEIQKASLSENQAFGVMIVEIEPPPGFTAHVGAMEADVLIARVAATLRETGPGVLFGRFSDWRIVFTTNQKEESSFDSDGREIAEIMCFAASMPVEMEGSTIAVKAAVGFSIVRSTDDDLNLVLINAESALEQAVSQYAQRTQMFDADLAERKIRGRTLRADLPDLNESTGLRVVFQPIVAADSSDVRGFEALVRWQHPVLGLVSPVEFIPLTEALGVIDVLGLEIVRVALKDFSQSLQTVYPDSYLSVNVSVLQLREPHFVSNLISVCRTANVAAESVVLEITETQFVEGDETVDANLARLRGIGFRFSMDDFGTGYSSLWRLGQIDVQTIKVARELIIAAVHSESGKLLLQRAVQICKDLKCNVIAEGIEGDIERAHALEAGCDQLQGYMFSKPLDAAGLLTHLAWRQASVD